MSQLPERQVGPDYLTKAEFEEFCDLIAQGVPATKASQAVGKDRTNVGKWLRWHASPEQHRSYAYAQEDGADALAEEVIDISDDDGLDVGYDEEGKPYFKGQHVARSRLRVDSRKWLAGKKYPRKYGDRAYQVQEGGEKPVEIMGVVRVEGPVADQIDRILDKQGP